MRKRYTPAKNADEPLSRDGWLALPVQASHAGDGYLKADRSIRHFFQTHQPLDWQHAVLGLHIVYGWMPTIPDWDRIMAIGDDEGKTMKLLQSLNVATHGPLAPEQLDSIVSFCNESYIGASKFLHFLSPQVFPIWDLRVAKAFLKRRKLHWNQANRAGHWTNYKRTLSKWTKDNEVQGRCDELRARFPDLEGVSDLRVIEWVLFQSVPSKRRARSSRAGWNPTNPVAITSASDG